MWCAQKDQEAGASPSLLGYWFRLPLACCPSKPINLVTFSFQWLSFITKYDRAPVNYSIVWSLGHSPGRCGFEFLQLEKSLKHRSPTTWVTAPTTRLFYRWQALTTVKFEWNGHGCCDLCLTQYSQSVLGMLRAHFQIRNLRGSKSCLSQFLDQKVT